MVIELPDPRRSGADEFCVEPPVDSDQRLPRYGYDRDRDDSDDQPHPDQLAVTPGEIDVEVETDDE